MLKAQIKSKKVILAMYQCLNLISLKNNAFKKYLIDQNVLKIIKMIISRFFNKSYSKQQNEIDKQDQLIISPKSTEPSTQFLIFKNSFKYYNLTISVIFNLSTSIEFA